MSLFEKIWSVQIFRFLLVGGLNTGFSYLVYVIFLYCGLNFSIANLIALISGVAFSFVTSSKLIFQVKGHFLKYLLFWASLYGINIFLISILIDWGCNAYLAGFIALPIITALSYIAQKTIVFKDERLM